MAEFLDKITLIEINDVIFQVTDLPFRYKSDLLPGVIEVPIGFETDFASVPRLVLIYNLVGDVAHEPAVIHDWLYYSGTTTREIADKVLFEAMGVIKIPAWRRYPIYWGVRIGGWVAWNQHRKAGHKASDLLVKDVVKGATIKEENI